MPSAQAEQAALDASAKSADSGKSADSANSLIHAERPEIKTATPKPTFKIGSKFSRTLQTVTGINFVTEVVASQVAKAAVRKKTGGKVKVKVKTYSLTDLIAGKVKSVAVQVDDPEMKGMKLGQVKMASQNPIWVNYRNKKNGERPGFKAPTMMLISANINQEQLAQSLKSPRLTASLSGLKLDLPGLGGEQLEPLNPKVQIVGDKIILEAVLVTKGGTIESGVPIKITARPELVGDSKIILQDLQVEGPDIVEPEKFARFAQELLNPLIDFSRLDRRDHAFRMAGLNVSGGGIAGDGKLLLVPKAPITPVIPVAPVAPVVAPAPEAQPELQPVSAPVAAPVSTFRRPDEGRI